MITGEIKNKDDKTSGFLVASGEYMQKHHGNLFTDLDLKNHYNNTMFYGFDMDRTMLRIGAMSLRELENNFNSLMQQAFKGELKNE